MSRAARHLASTSLLLSLAVAGCGGGSNESDASLPDGATPIVDANVDARIDAAAACHVDLDCNDGLYCNGVEHCTAGHCIAGSSPSCADDIACTRDFCSEERQTCVHEVPDHDMDGHGDILCVNTAGLALGDDCADDDAHRFPGNTEVCDTMMHDEDCVMTTHGHVDNDSDGFEDIRCCNGTDCGTDCDDSNRGVNTAATEVCDHIDDDCDTHVDEMVGVPMYPDADRDGFGDHTVDEAHRTTQCGDTVGWATLGGDCDDDNVAKNPGQLEVCDTIDNDCDLAVDENAGNVPWYVDADHDGYGDAHGATLVQCTPPTGNYSLVSTDCDDTTSSRSPRAPEVCNAIDDDCNGLADFAITPGDLEDDDHDHVADTGCGLPRGLDCNDRDASALPGAPEICNGRDDDCDSQIDEMATSATFHHDADGDGFGDPGTAVIACFAPAMYVADASDCDDTVVARHPGAAETCNAIDDDCDRRIDETPAASSCSIAGAVTACTVGICHEVGCQPGFSDCTLADGCETPTLADDLQCGACNHSCGGGTQCVQSTCVPGGTQGVVGASRADDSGTAIAQAIVSGSPMLVLGGSFSGTGFGVGCGTHYDAMGIAGIVGVRDSDGICQATLAIDGTGDEAVTALALDPSGALFVALTTTSATLSVGGMSADASAGQAGRDVVIARLLVSGTPSTISASWVHRFGGMFDDTITDLAVDGADLWAVGAMRGPAGFDTGSLGPGPTTDSVVIHFASGGSVAGVVSALSSGNDGARSVTLDADHVYIAGSLSGTGTFGTTTLTSAGGTDGYLWVLSRTDASTTFARAFGDLTDDVTTGVALSGGTSGAVLALSGTFTGTVSIDGIPHTSAGMSDGFVVGLDASFHAVWFASFGGTLGDAFADLVYVSGTYVAAGTFTGSAHLAGDDAGVTSNGSTDIVIIGVNTSGFSFGSPTTLGGAGHDDAYALARSISPAQALLAGDYSGSWSNPQSAGTFPGIGGLDALWLAFYTPGS